VIRGVAGAAVVLATTLSPASGAAQTTTLTITGGSTATFNQPTLADYNAGYIDGPTINFSVSLLGGVVGATHTTTVEICAGGGSLGSGKAVSDLLWQPSDGSKPWQAITTSCSGQVKASRTVASQVLGSGGSWSGGVRLRMVLNWTDTAPSYGTTIGMVVSVSTP
jgi:hypothetical protein